jgi:hypothetical protein
VKDDARLHVAALINSDVANERIFAMAEKFTWKYVLLTILNSLVLISAVR